MAECGYLGRANGDLRNYTKDECESKLGGNWHENGECTKKGGGSWSWDCRYLNSDPLAMAYGWRWYVLGVAGAGAAYGMWKWRRGN